MIRESQNCRRHCRTGGSAMTQILANILAVLAFFALLFFAYVAFA